jgi:drug/metabolite transporter (DMT)-like permease
MINQYRGYIWVLLSATGFGLGPIFAKLAYAEGASVQVTLLFRFFIGALLLWGYIYWKKIPLSREPRVIMATFLLGGIGYATMAWCYFSSVQYISSSLAVLLLYTNPIMVTLWCALFLKEKITLRLIGSLIIALTGLFFVLGVGFYDINPTGLAYALGAATVYSIYIVVGGHTVSSVSPLIVTAYVATAASASFFILFLVTDEWRSLTPIAWASLLAIAVSTMVVAVLCFFAGMALIGASKTSLISMFEPLVTILFSAILFQERLSGFQWLGGILILMSIFILVYKRKVSVRPVPLLNGADPLNPSS